MPKCSSQEQLQDDIIAAMKVLPTSAWSCADITARVAYTGSPELRLALRVLVNQGRLKIVEDTSLITTYTLAPEKVAPGDNVDYMPLRKLIEQATQLLQCDLALKHQVKAWLRELLGEAAAIPAAPVTPAPAQAQPEAMAYFNRRELETAAAREQRHYTLAQGLKREKADPAYPICVPARVVRAALKAAAIPSGPEPRAVLDRCISDILQAAPGEPRVVLARASVKALLQAWAGRPGALYAPGLSLLREAMEHPRDAGPRTLSTSRLVAQAVETYVIKLPTCVAGGAFLKAFYEELLADNPESGELDAK